MVRPQDPMTRQTGWYVIQRRLKGGKFATPQEALWLRHFDNIYGEWIYQDGSDRTVDEQLKDDLVLRSVKDD
ncbi:MAG: hypothetical protein J6S67_22135 [Methanobrevibacter sp.]|nr:hypothetical protein [Methanobrevibacter sp.]